MTLSETERQQLEYSKEIAAYTFIQISAARAALAQNKAAADKLPIAHATLNNRTSDSTDGMLNLRLPTHCLIFFRPTEVELFSGEC
jgi:hypothetical protein